MFDYIPSTDRIYNTRNAVNIPRIKSKHDFFKNSYIPSTIIERNKLDQDIRNAESYALFRKHLLSFIRPEANNIFNVHNTKGIKLLTRLQVGFSHLKEHKFRHNFVDAINPLCSCGNFVESTTHFFLHCTHFSNQRLTLINKIKDIDKRVFDKKWPPHNPHSSFGRRKTFHNRQQIYIRSNNSVFNIFRKIWLTVVSIARYFTTLNRI